MITPTRGLVDWYFELRQSCHGEPGVPLELRSLPAWSFRRALHLIEGI